jgi:peptidoglycan/xylan/chitin deacetylase (PgdA/CDA1 family)
MTPTFTFSVDVEGLWGVFFVERYRTDTVAAEGARRSVPELVRLLDERRIRATFAFVGHLLLESCPAGAGPVHPEMPRPAFPWWPGDWYAHDPRSDEARDPDWYGLSLLRAVRASATGHEIASHGFSHAVFDEDGGCSREVADAELRASRAAGAAQGCNLTSLIYPQNVIGYRELLGPAGYRCYRAPDGGIDQRAGPPGGAHRAARLARHFLASEPPVGRPRMVHGVVEIPSSLPIVGGEGVRAWIGRRARAERCRRGLEAARREEAVFHLWTHPHAFARKADSIYGALEDTLDRVAAMRDRGDLVVRTMGEMTDEFLAAEAAR